MLSYSRNLVTIKLSFVLIIGFSSPVNPLKLVTKRIIAMENDVVQTRRTHPFQKVTVPTGHLWVEGDEAYHSKDSNDYGPVSAHFSIYLVLMSSRFRHHWWKRGSTISSILFIELERLGLHHKI